MPLFSMKVAVTEFVEIPVYAKTRDEAVAYASGTEEWKNDNGFLFADDDASYEIVSINEIISPDKSPFHGDWACYTSDPEFAGDDVTVAEALFGIIGYDGPELRSDVEESYIQKFEDVRIKGETDGQKET